MKLKKNHIAFLLMIGIVLAGCKEYRTISDGRTEIRASLDRWNRFRIEHIEYLETGARFDLDASPLWELDVRERTAPGKPHYVDGSTRAATSTAWDVEGNRLRMEWQGIPLGHSPGETAGVSLSVEIRDDGKAAWDLEASVTGENGILHAKHPFFLLPPVGEARTDDTLCVPVFDGGLVRDPIAAGNGHPGGSNDEDLQIFKYPSQMMMQFFAYYDEENGLYLACEDGEGHTKSLYYEGLREADRLEILVKNYNSSETLEGLGEYTQPYAVVTDFFAGDWLTAAKIYREWARKQKWVAERRPIPQKQEDRAYTMLYRIPADEVTALDYETIDSVVAYFNATPGIPPDPAVLFAGPDFGVGSHGGEMPGGEAPAEYKPGFPEFAAYMRDRFPESILSVNFNTNEWQMLGDYGCNPDECGNGCQRPQGSACRLWYQDYGAQGAVKKPNGKVHKDHNKPNKAVPEGRDVNHMCQGSVWWVERQIETLMANVESSAPWPDVPAVNSVALTGTPVPYPCYDTFDDHEHPLGGGAWWSDGWRETFNEVLDWGQANIDEGFFALSESNAEQALDTSILLYKAYHPMDDMVAWGAPLPGIQYKPMFAAVYHDFQIACGGGKNATLFSNFVKTYEEDAGLHYDFYGAEDFVAGKTVGVSVKAGTTTDGFQGSGLDEQQSMDYLRKLIQFRVLALAYLRHGEYVRPPLAEEVPRVAMEFMIKGEPQSMQIPSIVRSAWRGRDGSVGFIFTNFTAAPAAADVTIDVELYGLGPGLYEVWRVDGEGERLDHTFSGTVDLIEGLEVEAKDVVFLKMVAG